MSQMFRSLALVLGMIAACGSTSPAAAPKKAYPRDPAKVFVHAVPLYPADQLTDGDTGEAIAIKETTTLVWVDLYPNARYAHPTQYVLISPAGTRVIDGSWWPVLNGKPLFRDAKTASADVPAK